ncbi:hypothetical protein BU23DRAFT_570237 [Bimuria novae-zelandiae CBS 107.79]|uniref:Uncharacterized protein n=1 Tax=Bimuria novae-zelandiae CBS 107.79 TaxID=1447943 RepID=A0A6A5V152_9PLEO|nr:hypothetical protein BU23DRAFT_570237 [Bimuria novae-zelandiae CBS 107.79]
MDPPNPTIQLPKEIRLLVYDCIVQPGSQLCNYQGIILASKDSYREIEVHYMEAFIRIQQEVRAAWPLDAPITFPTPKNLQDAHSLRICVPHLSKADFSDKHPVSKETRHFFTVLVGSSKKCTLVPDPGQCKSRDEQMECLERLQGVIWKCLIVHKHISLRDADQQGWTPRCMCVVSPREMEGLRSRPSTLFLKFHDDIDVAKATI